MSDYDPINDEPEQAQWQQNKAEHSYSSHPYKSGYGNQSRGQYDSQAIDVASPAGVYGGEPTAGPSTFNSQDGGQRISRYETSLPIRHDVEAAIAYALNIYSGVFLLITEKKNDYVRFHAWQSSLLSIVFIIALIVTAFISNFLYWVTWILAIAVDVYMVRRAYIDGAVFERFALPYVGQWATQFVDEE